MNEIQKSAISLLEKWFDKAENWQKDLFVQLWQGNDDNDSMVTRAFSLAKQEYLGEKSRFTPAVSFPREVELSNTDNNPLFLESISEVQGVGALAPTRPLNFGKNLTVVYGENGCGKSSYVRILKSAASPKTKQSILNNIYIEQNKPTQATLKYNDDGQETVIKWKPGMNASCPLNIYDSSVAKQFAEQENEVIYEPKILSLISVLVAIYQVIANKFNSLLIENNSLFSTIDDETQHHHLVSTFNSITTEKSLDSFFKTIVWTDKENDELDTLQNGLQKQDPLETLKILKAQKDIIVNQYNDLIDLASKVGQSFSDKYLLQRKQQIDTKEEADKLVDALNQVSLLKRTGSDDWRAMWNNASKFASSQQDPSELQIVVDGKCALCQQEISIEAEKRIEQFSKFMASNAIIRAQKAFDDFEATVRALQSINNNINLQKIEISLKASQVPDEQIIPILNAYKTIVSRCKWLLNYSDSVSTDIPDSVSISELQDEKDRINSDLSNRISALQGIINNRGEQIDRHKYLLAVKWVFENKNHRRKDIILKQAISKCKTNAVTTLKKDLTELLITNTYINRFQEEMDYMDLQHKIRVELVSKGAKKGRAYHQVALKGAVGEGRKKSTGDVLSEGEYRVVSLAAFLADLSSWNRVLPFVFDDPINSLDHKYEMRVANRLVALSSERQVIVFTHRLAFAQLLLSSVDEYNNKQQELEKTSPVIIEQIELRNAPLGEPINPNYHGATKMKNALSLMKTKDVVNLKRKYKDGDYDSYRNGIKSLCSDFRTIIEQGIETDLLSNIVNRFGYSVNSLRLRYLYVVTPEDIDKFNNMMTKYSAFEHSQSPERPIQLPEISEIETDIDDMLTWCKSFQTRSNAVDKKK